SVVRPVQILARENTRIGAATPPAASATPIPTH
ncbi:Bgt-20783-2, partial [Blumeria graminis f. sp. tritici]